MNSTTINIWHAATSSDHPGRVESCCENWLDEEEVERANRFRKPTSRNQHVVGRGMARRLLSNPDFGPEQIRFGAEVHGKPFVSDPPQAKQPFNIAHTDGLVLCGLCDGPHRLIGVDVEKLCRRTDPELAERYFSKPEVEFLRTKPDQKSVQDTFLRIWTLKESFIKAIGTGLQTPLADFAFSDIDSDTPKITMLKPELESNLTWNFFSISPKPGFVGAVAIATEAPDPNIKLRLSDFGELID